MSIRDKFGQEIKKGSIICFVMNDELILSKVNNITKSGIVMILNPDKNSKTKTKKLKNPEKTVIVSLDTYKFARSWMFTNFRD